MPSSRVQVALRSGFQQACLVPRLTVQVLYVRLLLDSPSTRCVTRLFCVEVVSICTGAPIRPGCTVPQAVVAALLGILYLGVDFHDHPLHVFRTSPTCERFTPAREREPCSRLARQIECDMPLRVSIYATTLVTSCFGSVYALPWLAYWWFSIPAFPTSANSQSILTVTILTLLRGSGFDDFVLSPLLHSSALPSSSART